MLQIEGDLVDKRGGNTFAHHLSKCDNVAKTKCLELLLMVMRSKKAQTKNKRDRHYISFKIDAGKSALADVNLTNQILDRCLSVDSSRERESEKTFKRYIESIRLAYVNAGHDWQRLVSVLGCTHLRAQQLTDGIDFRSITAWELFKMKELSEIKPDPTGTRDIAKEVMKLRKK